MQRTETFIVACNIIFVANRTYINNHQSGCRNKATVCKKQIAYDTTIFSFLQDVIILHNLKINILKN